MASSAGTMPNTGRWGWYKDHNGDEFRRVSSLIKKVETDNFALEEWKKRQVLVGAARRNDIVLGVKALGEVPPLGWSQQTKRQLGKWAEECMTAAGSDTGRISGTAMHDLTERVDRGEPIEDVVRELPALASHDLRAYAKLRELNGWKSVEIERTVVCDELGVAGSFDRIDLIPGLTAKLGPWACQHDHDRHTGPSIVIVDVKTESSPLLNGLHIGPQLAVYSRARRMWLPTPQYVDAPCVRQDVAVIVHVRDGKAIPYFVDLTAGWEAAQAAARQLERERAAKKWFAPVPGIIEPKPAEILTEVAVAAQWASPDRPAAGQVLTSGLATAMLDASKMTATALGPAPMPSAWHTAVNTACNNCASLVASATRVDGTYCDETCHQCGKTALEATTPVEPVIGIEVAETGPDGLVHWRTEMVPATEHNSKMDDVDKSAYSAIMQAPDLASLAETYRIYTEVCGREWGGSIAAAAEQMRKQIECPQKALHTAGTCACGWSA